MYLKVFKPLIDTALAFSAIIVLTPLWIVVSIWIKIDSEGPVFFLQERLGRNTRPFKVIKFRSMTHRKRSIAGQTYVERPEITGAGKVLRRYKIDELPQLFNVLKGDMALVGPRPCLQQTRDKFGDNNTPFRFKVKPGLTSPAGVNGSIYLTWPDKWWYDRWYVEHLSFYTDVSTIWKTILVVFLGEKQFLNKPEDFDGN